MEIEDRKHQRYIKKLHKDILIIMDEVDRICHKYHLNYYLMCGSCLGAVRHQGFIPWDDDLDVAMPRNDFNRLISLIKENSVLDERFYLRWVDTERYYNQDFAKVCLKGTVFQTNMGKADQRAGIFVDIFPLDPSEQYSPNVEKKSKLYKHLHSCLYLKGAEAGAMDWNIKHWPRNLLAILFSNQNIYKIMLWVIKSRRNYKEDYQALYSTPYPIKRQIFPKAWHGEGILMDFENRKYICPSEPKKVMQMIYGDNFMELPPVEKRKTHCPMKVVFSDGEEMTFDKVNSEITYNDILD